MRKPRPRLRTVVRVLVGALLAGTILNSPAFASSDHGPLDYYSHPQNGPAGLTYLANDSTRAVVAVGDLEHATRIAVLIPGVGNTRADVGDDARSLRTDRGLVANARNLYGQMIDEAPDATVAVIAWLGYEPVPVLTPLALDRGPADAGAKDLDRLAALLPATALVTWICHSYGTLVCAKGAEDASAQQRPDRMILLGSPGTDASSAASFGGVDVWAAAAPSDFIAMMPEANNRILHDMGLTFGPSPTSPAFGAHVIDVPSGGHFDYFLPGSSSLVASARIAVGLPPTPGIVKDAVQ